TVQGGTQAMTRSLGARMIPKSKSGEFFGFVSVLIKFAGMVGPLLFALVAQAVGSSRPAFLSLVVFFLGGMFVLSRVDEEAGVQAAQEVNGGG
ncbi:MAG: MFS transporter, partial [Anaerolineae bacterium]|nr:MFS transporter [Anaerolineae bacterium]